jgi:hypothetical protein
MVELVSARLRIDPKELRIYNLVQPSKGRGMNLAVRELGQAEDTVRRLATRVRRRSAIQRIVVGGASGPMPQVALTLKLLIPRVRIELRSHHRARAVNEGPLRLVRTIRP